MNKVSTYECKNTKHKNIKRPFVCLCEFITVKMVRVHFFLSIQVQHFSIHGVLFPLIHFVLCHILSLAELYCN